MEAVGAVTVRGKSVTGQGHGRGYGGRLRARGAGGVRGCGGVVVLGVLVKRVIVVAAAAVGVRVRALSESPEVVLGRRLVVRVAALRRGGEERRCGRPCAALGSGDGGGAGPGAGCCVLGEMLRARLRTG